MPFLIAQMVPQFSKKFEIDWKHFNYNLNSILDWILLIKIVDFYSINNHCNGETRKTLKKSSHEMIMKKQPDAWDIV